MPGIGLYLIILLVVMGTVGVLLDFPEAQEPVTYSDVIKLFQEEKVDAFVIQGNDLTMQLKDESLVSYELPDVNIFYYDLGELITQQRDSGVIRMQDFKVEKVSWLTALVPYIILFAILGAFCLTA